MAYPALPLSRTRRISLRLGLGAGLAGVLALVIGLAVSVVGLWLTVALAARKAVGAVVSPAETQPSDETR